MQVLHDTPLPRPIQRLYHISDIHIRLYARLHEYEEVFENLYAFLENESDGLIVITGDILHHKNELSPECILATHRFLSRLATIFPTIMIAGNHDALLNNKNRMDSLSAVLHISIPDLFYLRTTGFYRYGNIVFGLSSLLDNQFLPMTDDDRVEGCAYVALFHGGVGRFSTNKGYIMEGIPVSRFAGYDMTLLGDIHLFQYLDNDKRVAYAGSLISQNFTETDPDHGVLVWDVRSRTSHLVRIENPYAYREVILEAPYFQMEGRRYLPGEIDLPKKGRVNVVFSRQKTASDIRAMVELQERFPDLHISEKTVCRIDPLILGQSDNVPQPQNLDFTRLLQSYFDRLDYENKDDLFSLCLESSLSSSSTAANNASQTSSWDILTMEFDNMFGYGGQNRLDMERFPVHETIGIFGENSAGKSTLIDILLFLLYGQISRYAHGASVPREVIHFGETRSRGMIRFRVDGNVYEIEKHMTLSPKTQKIRVEEKMWRLEEGQRKEDLSEEHRKKTDKLVTRRIGSCAQFLFTTIFLQQNEESFRAMTPAKRKEFLFHILDLDRFEKLHQEKNDEYRLLKKELERGETALREMESEKTCREKIAHYQEMMTTIEIRSNHLRDELGTVQQDIREVVARKRPCPPHVVQEWEQNEQKIQTLEERTRNIQKTIVDHQRRTEQCRQAWRAHEMFHEADMDGCWKTTWSELETLYKQQIAPPQTPSIQELFRGMETEPFVLRSIDDYSPERYREIQRRTPEPEDMTSLLRQKDELLRVFDARLSSSMSEEEIVEVLDRPFTLPHSAKMLETLSERLRAQYEKHWEWSKEWKEWVFNDQCDACQRNQTRIGYDRKMEEESAAAMQSWTEMKTNLRLHQEKEQAERIRQNRSIEAQLSSLEQQIRKEKEKAQRNKNLERARAAWERVHQWYENKSQIEFMNSYVDKEIQKKKIVLKRLEEARRLRDAFQGAESDLSRALSEQEMTRVQLDETTRHRDRLRQWLEDGRANEEDDRRYQDLIGRQKQIEGGIQDLFSQEKTIERELRAWTDRWEARQEKMRQYDATRGQHRFLQQFLSITGKDGFPMFMMESYLPFIEAKMNEIVSPFLAGKNVRLRIDKKKESVNILLTLQSKETESIYMGGMEGFIVDAALKIVFAHISRQPRCNLFIIDEGISALDKKNMENIDQFFQFLETYFKRVFVISHLREVHDMLRHAILVRKEDGKSRLCY